MYTDKDISMIGQYQLISAKKNIGQAFDSTVILCEKVAWILNSAQLKISTLKSYTEATFELAAVRNSSATVFVLPAYIPVSSF